VDLDDYCSFGGNGLTSKHILFMPVFLSPASLSSDQVEQLLQLSISAKRGVQDEEGPRETLEQKLGDLAAKFFSAVSSTLPQRKPCCG